MNRLMDRKGAVFAERYHAHELRSPLEVRRALDYVLNNARKHGYLRGAFDPFSSAPYFDGFSVDADLPRQDPAPVAPPSSWLLAVGWRRRGLIDPAPLQPLG